MAIFEGCHFLDVLFIRTRDQSSGTIFRDVVPKPLKKNEHSIFETGKIHDVNKEPTVPSDFPTQANSPRF